MKELTNRTVSAIRELVVSGQASAVEICRAHIEHARAVEPQIQACRAILESSALEEAKRIDGDRRAGRPLGPLAGVPVAIKDALCTRGAPTTAGSRILEKFVPTYDATCVRRLREAGAVIVSKTNLDEFAMGSSSENSAFEIPRNPWDTSRVAGGSSGGSAAVVAAGEVPAALGADTGGSVRQPASFCGVPGMKPSYGRVSRYGLIAFASSLDQVGTIGRTVEDVARILGVIAGRDPCDATSAAVPVPDYTTALTGGIDGMRLGVPTEYFMGGITREVESAVRATLRLAEEKGASLVEISLPHTEYAVPAYYIIATAEASSNLARYDGVRYGHRAEGVRDLSSMYFQSRREGFGQEVKLRIMLGTYVLSAGYYDAYYLKGQKVRTMIRNDFEKAFENVDAILTPTSPTPAFRRGEKLDDPLAMYLSDVFTVTSNLAGLPGISIPCGLTDDRLPIGLQILGPNFQEERVLRIAAALERELQFDRERPPVPSTPPDR